MHQTGDLPRNEVDLLGVGGNLHLRLRLADIQPQIDNGILADREFDAFAHCRLEPGCRDTDLVLAGLQHRVAPASAFIRCDLTGCTGCSVGKFDRGLSQHGP